MAKKQLKLLVIQDASAPDYLADMISHFIYSNSLIDYSIHTNSHPEYIFNDFSQDIALYGKGFTLYRQVNYKCKDLLELLPTDRIKENISRNYYDKIIWTSIRRCSIYLHLAIVSSYTRESLICIDGQDDQYLAKIMGEVNPGEFVTYYKREIGRIQDGLSVEPISFKFPHVHTLLDTRNVKKTQVLAQCDPRFKGTYVFTDEQSYYRNYSKSLFGFTTRKAGWDCLRHYEILACHCLPIFAGFEDIPDKTMVEWDRTLQLEVNNLWLLFSRTDTKDIKQLLKKWRVLMNKFIIQFRSKMLTNNYQRLFV